MRERKGLKRMSRPPTVLLKMTNGSVASRHERGPSSEAGGGGPGL